MLTRFDHTRAKTVRARRLWHNGTPAEHVLWSKLRTAQMEGQSFRRQHPVGPYVLDFYCPAVRLAIEVDGGQHGNTRRSISDTVRDAWLGGRGIHVLRYWNSDIFSNLAGVLDDIRRVVLSLAAGPADPSPDLRSDPPLSGEGEAPVADRVSVNVSAGQQR